MGVQHEECGQLRHSVGACGFRLEGIELNNGVLVVDEYWGLAKVKLAAQFPIFNAFGDQNDTIKQLGSSSKAKALGL